MLVTRNVFDKRNHFSWFFMWCPCWFRFKHRVFFCDTRNQLLLPNLPEEGRFLRPGGRTTVQFMSSVFSNICSISCMLLRTLRISGSRRNRISRDDCAPEFAESKSEKHRNLSVSLKTNRYKSYKAHWAYFSMLEICGHTLAVSYYIILSLELYIALIPLINSFPALRFIHNIQKAATPISWSTCFIFVKLTIMKQLLYVPRAQRRFAAHAYVQCTRTSW